MSPVFVEMIYMLPEHSQTVQVMMFKINDEAPDFPKSQAFIDNLKASVDGKILNYRILTKDLIDSEKHRDIFDEDFDNITVH
tara:strand:+ start:142 stop:387 length:246 start_codon:yes stop_codon:yes gene_type:complete